MGKKVLFAVQIAFLMCLALRASPGQEGYISRSQLRSDWNILPEVVHRNPAAEWGYNDYFSPKINLGLLQKVEAYHFSADNFFLKYNARQYDYALEELKYTLFVYPNHPKALMMVESIARLINQRALPLPYYERALKLFPERAFTHYQFGEYLLGLDYVGPAMKSLERATSLDPKMAVAFAALAKAYQRSGRTDLAQASAKKAIELGYKGKIFPPAANKTQDRK